MKTHTLKQIARKLGYERSEDLLRAHNTNASRMSQMKRRNPQGYENVILDMVLKEKDIKINDLIDTILDDNDNQFGKDLGL